MSLLADGGGKNEGSTSSSAGSGDSGGTGGTSGSASGGGTGAASGGGSGSGSNPTWRDSLPEEMRADPTLGKYNDINSLAKAHVDLQKFVGKKGIFPPGEKATPEQWKDFFKAAGQPEFDKFGVKLPEGKQFNTELIDGFKKTAHESGLLPQQAQGVLDWFLGVEENKAKASAVQADLQTKNQIAELRKEWGEGFDKEIGKAKLAAKELGIQEYLEKTGLGNDVTLVKALAKAGALYGEDKLRGEGGGSFGQTPDEIKAEIVRIQSDLKGPYYDKNHMGPKAAVQQMENLYQKLYR